MKRELVLFLKFMGWAIVIQFVFRLVGHIGGWDLTFARGFATGWLGCFYAWGD